MLIVMSRIISMRTHLHTMTSVFVLVLASGCAAIIESTLSEKVKSLEPFGTYSLQGKPIKQFLKERTAALMAGVPVGIEVAGLRVTKEGKVLQYSKQPMPKGTKSRVGSATAISEDGYFLTARHNVEVKGEVWLDGKTNSDPYIGKARLVWKSQRQDLALLKIDARPMHFFELGAQSPKKDNQVFLGGLRGSASAGKIIAVIEKADDSGSLGEIHHTAPTMRGDSGGPLISKGGHLLGINSFGGVRIGWPSGVVTRTIVPDVTDLRSIIEEDRARASSGGDKPSR